jgi:hypothetical protein
MVRRAERIGAGAGRSVEERSEKGVGSEVLARAAWQSWHKISEWLTNYNWTGVQAGLTEGRASAGDHLNFREWANAHGLSFLANED